MPPPQAQVPLRHLLTLEPEVRNEIWEMAVTYENPLVITPRRARTTFKPRLLKERNRGHRTALLLVNRQTRFEAMGLFFSNNSFRIQDRSKGIPDAQRSEDEIFSKWSRSLVSHTLPTLPSVSLSNVNILINLYRRPISDAHFRVNLINMLDRLQELCVERYPSVRCTIELGQITCLCGQHETIEVGELSCSKSFTVPVKLDNLVKSIDDSATDFNCEAAMSTDNVSLKALRFAGNRMSSLASEMRSRN